MPTPSDITPEFMQELYEKNRLGQLGARIPDRYHNNEHDLSVKIDLKTLWSITSNLYNSNISAKNIDINMVTPDNISAVCIYGSTLYRNFPREIKRTKKTWFGFGKKTKEVIITKKRKDPSDLDLMVITNQPAGDFMYYYKKNKLSWSGLLRGDYATYFHTESFPLHVTFRSIDQFIESYVNKDEIVNSVVEYGLPLVGKLNFDSILNKLSKSTGYNRSEYHNITWDLCSKLDGRIIESNSKIKTKGDSINQDTSIVGTSKTNESNESKIINPWDIEFPKIENKILKYNSGGNL